MEKGKRRVAIFGSTGSIGTQALDVISQHPELFEVEVLTANSQWEMLAAQARKFNPNAVVICNEEHYSALNSALSNSDVKVFAGMQSVVDLACSDNIDIVVAAMVGFSGLRSTMAAIKAGKTIALANKETLVAAGHIVTKLSSRYDAPIIPVDSEHSAIFQSIQGEGCPWCPPFSYKAEGMAVPPIEKLVLTASGGPFREWKREDIEKATASQALKHPNWNMGAKVTIDSASMLNKGLEIMEASWLFNVPVEKIEVVVHPQSIVHSMVQFTDGSLKAQLGFPDMRVPIGYALTYPHRRGLNTSRISFPELSQLTFFKPDLEKFPCLALAYRAQGRGGSLPCTMNGANEVAVAMFLKDMIPFGAIPHIIEESMDVAAFVESPSLDDIFEADREARRIAADVGRRFRL